VLFAFVGGGLVLVVQFFAALSWASGADAADPSGKVSDSLFPFPGSQVSYDPLSDGFNVEINPGWSSYAVTAVVFVMIARPWRVVTARRAAGT
jgi:hypothetical protein